MGTSKPYKPPSSPQWQYFKSEMTRIANAGSMSSSAANGLIGNFIAANGGAAKMAHGDGGGGGAGGGSRAAQSVARNIAGFVTAVAEKGLPAALQEYGLESLEGKSVNEVLFSLIDQLGGDANTLDDVDARSALSRLLDELFENAEINDIEAILAAKAGESELQSFLEKFYGYYLYERFCRVSYETLATRVGHSKADSALKGILDYIKAAIRQETQRHKSKRINWRGREGKRLSEIILKETLEVFGTA